MKRNPDKHNRASVHDSTWAVHGGNNIDKGTGALRTPLIMANSYLLPEDPSDMDWSSVDDGLVYNRTSGANSVALETKLATMEGAEAAATFATGVAALHGIFFSFLEVGDHVVVSNVTYEAVYRLFGVLLPKKYGIEVTFVDIADLEAVQSAVRPNTKLIHAETIANPTTKVANVAALSRIAKDAGVLLTIDATFTPAPFYRALDDGADLVVHSLTKYINGHGDAMGGVVAGRRELIQHIKHEAVVEVGGVISPFNAWMIMRGSVTLPLRLKQHFSSAEKVAAVLESDPRVAYVLYPGLASHPEHETAVNQFGGRGYGGVLAFAVDGDSGTQNRFVNNLQVITSAVSLGHDESLIVHVGPDARGGSENYPASFHKYGHLRLSVGLEDAEDIIDDLLNALDKTFPGQ